MSDQPRFAKCACGSSRIHRTTETGEHAGPLDMCLDCSATFPAKPGSITMAQHRLRNAPQLDSKSLKTGHARSLFGEK